MRFATMTLAHVILCNFVQVCVNQGFAQELSISRFIGNWEGEGTLFNSPAKFELEFSMALNNKFLRVEFRNEYMVKEKKYSMEARAYYAILQDSLAGHWFDSRGVQLPVAASINKTSLTSYWGNSLTEQGKTIYKLEGEEKLTVTDFVMRNGEFVQFGLADYKKIRYPVETN